MYKQMYDELLGWYRMTTQSRDDIKPSVLLKNTKVILSSDKYLKNCGFVYILYGLDKDDNVYLDEIFQENKELRNLTDWVKDNIIFGLSDKDYITIGVLFRIFTGMLNKINIPKQTKLLIHTTVYKNIHYLYYLIQCEDLPF